MEGERPDTPKTIEDKETIGSFLGTRSGMPEEWKKLEFSRWFDEQVESYKKIMGSPSKKNNKDE